MPKTIQVRVSDTFYDNAAMAAHRRGVRLSELVRNAVMSYVLGPDVIVSVTPSVNTEPAPGGDTIISGGERDGELLGGTGKAQIVPGSLEQGRQPPAPRSYTGIPQILRDMKVGDSIIIKRPASYLGSYVYAEKKRGRGTYRVETLPGVFPHSTRVYRLS